MTPDLTTPQTIGISTALVGACLIFLLGFFIALAWREQILPYLYRHGILIPPHRRLRPQPPAPFPAHYILPYASTEQLLHEPVMVQTTGLQQCTPHHTDSIDDLPPRPPPPQRNATPGPSGTRQTPMPPPSSPEPETNDRDLRARYEQFPPPAYDPADIPPPERALLPVQPRPIMGFPTLPPGRIFIRPYQDNDPWPPEPDSDDDEAGDHSAPPAHQLPPPERFILIDSDDEDLDALAPPPSDTDVPESVSNDSRPPSPPPRPLALTYTEREDPLNINGPDFEWNELLAIDILILERDEPQWDGTLRSNEAIPSHAWEETRLLRPEYTTIETEPHFPLPPATYYRDAAPREQLTPSSGWSSPYLSYPLDRETRTQQDNNDFDHFHYEGMIENPYVDNEDGDYQGYSLAPYQLPDSPLLPHHPRRIQRYHPPQYGIHPMGGANDAPARQEEGGSNDIPVDPLPEPPIQQTPAERIQAAKDLADRKAQHIAELRQIIEDEENAHDEHVRYWNLPNQNQRKGKEADRGRRGAPPPPPDPNWQRDLANRDDRWSLPRPPPKWQQEPPQPTGEADDDAPWLGIKPVMIQPPVPFLGKYDDIEHFIGDCCMYFETFTPFFQLHSQRVAFATSYFEDAAKDWWVHQRQEFWVGSGWSNKPKRFRYPSWAEFVGLVSRQFHDPAMEDVHEQKMFNLRMGKGPAISYFNKLEIEAKKAGRRGDDQERGLMVKAVQLGVPDSYTNAIASSGENIPRSYNNWKRRILRIYEERQKKWVFDQTVGNRNTNPRPALTATTATSHHPKTGGATSSSSTKPTSSMPNTGGRDAGGRWLARPGTTYGGQGAPMDIGQMRAKGLCFRCHKQGHLSKDCPEKKDFRDIRSVQATREPVTESKIEEIAKDLLTGALLSSAGRSHGLFVGTSSNPTCIIKCTNIFPTHSNIPRLRAPAFNVSSTTSKPVSESQNRYAALSVEECNDTDNDNDTPLKGCHDTSSARAEAKAVNPAGHEAESLPTRPLLTLGQTDANHRASSLCGETQSTNVSGEKSTFTVTPIDNASLPRMTDGTKGSSKGSPNEVSYHHDQAAQTSGSTIPKVDVESQLDGEITARLPGQERVPSKETTTPQQQPFPVGRPGKVIEVMTSQSPGAEGGVGQPRSLDSTNPVVPVRLFDNWDDAPVRTSPSCQRIVLVEANQTNLHSPIAPGNVDEERLSKTAGDANATATKKRATGLEAASTQAVNRGHSTTMIEVPDEEDDTAYQIWLAKEQLPTIVEKGDEPSSVPTTPSPAQWFKPFEVDWTLRAVRKA
ncbi:uncharacterized protein ARMOST_11410 [Armillaria ostoyae]|uniref:CCHC-type domain-containing protein n=1 Tax=Armillaria ostoyae TaxID=47428 RepID=A0A284RH26_ARMOS|nr:uncharacterized protein ARMOST_11410 [Armillaria ostoyae]